MRPGISRSIAVFAPVQMLAGEVVASSRRQHLSQLQAVLSVNSGNLRALIARQVAMKSLLYIAVD
jgi:hypothetical protein